MKVKVHLFGASHEALSRSACGRLHAYYLHVAMARDKGLDEEFKRIMSDMKPHTKILPYKSGALDSDSNKYPPSVYRAAAPLQLSN